MILGVDTSAGTAVAVVEADGVIRAEAASADPLAHAEVIGDLLLSVLRGAGVTPADITHVAAGNGPGPFTGLRVGIAAARAFATGRGIPVIPIASHDAVALGILLRAALAGADAARFAVVTDARRREFAFTAYDDLDDDGLPVAVAGAQLTPRDEIDDRLATIGAERIDADAVPAAMTALVAARRLAAGRIPEASEPLYLRTPDVTLGHAPKRVTA